MKKALCLLIIIVAVSLNGCSMAEIDKTAIVDSIYIYPANDSLNENLLCFDFNTIKNENPSVLPRYSVTAETLAQAKEKLEQSAVPSLFLAQTECIVLSSSLDEKTVSHCLEYYKNDYECSPSVKVMFAVKGAIDELTEKDIPTERLIELCDIAKERDGETLVNIYSFYNKIIIKEQFFAKVPLLYSKSQLDAVPTEFYSIKTKK